MPETCQNGLAKLGNLKKKNQKSIMWYIHYIYTDAIQLKIRLVNSLKFSIFKEPWSLLNFKKKGKEKHLTEQMLTKNSACEGQKY